MKNNTKIVCYGEVLLDRFPTQTKIGGAPLNVSSRLQSFNTEVTLISCVGNDEEGKLITSFLKDKKVKTSLVQISNTYPTGQVDVKLDVNGVASYDIVYPVAWDKIQRNDQNIDAVKNADVFLFGSLVCRDNVSQATLIELLDHASYKVFDVNLRKPYYTDALLLDLMYAADFIKFNDDELYKIAANVDCKYHAMEQIIVFLAEVTKTETICVTKGAFGAVLYTNKMFYYNSGYRIKVVDTVGSGDSFLASLIYKLTSQQNPQEAVDFACAVGALVAGSEGANPDISLEEIQNFIHP